MASVFLFPPAASSFLTFFLKCIELIRWTQTKSPSAYTHSLATLLGMSYIGRLLKWPLNVCCLFSGALMVNWVPVSWPAYDLWPLTCLYQQGFLLCKTTVLNRSFSPFSINSTESCDVVKKNPSSSAAVWKILKVSLFGHIYTGLPWFGTVHLGTVVSTLAQLPFLWAESTRYSETI